MFEAAELGRKIGKKKYEEEEPILRQELLAMQQELRKCDFPVIVVFAGVDGAGKSDMVNILNEWMDPRWLLTRAYTEPSQDERERPEYWRYWLDLPPKGRLGMFLSSWYSRPVLDRVHEEISQAEFDKRLERIISFETALANEGALIIKFWMHLSKKAQKDRLKELEKSATNSWRVTENDWKHWRKYENFVSAAERALMRTSVGHAQWHIVEGEDKRYACLTVGKTLLEAVKKQMKKRKAERDHAQAQKLLAQEEAPANAKEVDFRHLEVTPSKIPTVLSYLKMNQGFGKKDAKEEINRWQGQLNQLSRKALEKGVSALVVFEGWDAAGKGGAIRRCTQALDARNYQVIPFAAPTEEERAQHYLWRFWRHLGRKGRFTFFDRSWYGRVLVERVEGFATEAQWSRAYSEINDFEEQLVEHGIVLVKFWVHITPEEQLARFKNREQTPWKSWKLTDEDWRNRAQWAQYEEAVNDMVSHTSTSLAPWTLVEGNDKNFTRVKVLKTLVEQMGKALK